MSLSFSYVVSVIIGLIGLTIMIIVHELGHFAAAKISKIRVESLSFGFGPVLKKWNRNGTEIRICLIPFGGSCKMAGRDDVAYAIASHSNTVEKCEDGSLYSVSPIKRIFTYLSGPLANIIFAFICYAVLLSLSVMTTFYPARISLVSDYPEYYPDAVCAAETSGLLRGDTVLSLNGTRVEDYSDIENILRENTDKPVVFETDRGTFKVTPINGSFGILPYEKAYKSEPGKPFFQALSISFRECLREVVSFVSSLYKMFAGKEKISSTISGTVGASAGIGLAAEKGFAAGFSVGIRIVLYILASVSISLGVANLIPISALDGGLILISLAELVCGHTLNPKTYIILQIAGLIVVFGVIPIGIIFF